MDFYLRERGKNRPPSSLSSITSTQTNTTDLTWSSVMNSSVIVQKLLSGDFDSIIDSLNK